MYERIVEHFRRIQRQFGSKTFLGSTPFTVKGYISNILTVDSPHEKELDQVLSRLLTNDGYFIDIGMNLGQTLGKVLSIDPARKYIGFEPQVMPCALVARFIEDNRLNRCHVLPIGLSNCEGIRRFYSNGLADVMGSLVHGENTSSVSFVQTRVGDQVISELGIEKICAIKIDVEGAEFEVLEGLAKTIDLLNPPIIFEVLPNFEGDQQVPVGESIASRRRERARQIIDFFAERDGYEIFQIRTNSEEVPVKEFNLDDTEMFPGSNYIARKSIS